MSFVWREDGQRRTGSAPESKQVELSTLDFNRTCLSLGSKIDAAFNQHAPTHRPLFLFLEPQRQRVHVDNMKVALIALFVTTASAFSPQPVGRTCTSSLNLFGSGGGEKKGPNMMDQLAMFKKAQEVAQKKGQLDKELMAMDFQGKAADGKVVAHVKYVPVTNPMDPNPDYEVISIEIDDTYFEETSPEDLSASLADAYQNGVEETNKAVMEKYQTLTTELSDVFGGKA